MKGNWYAIDAASSSGPSPTASTISEPIPASKKWKIRREATNTRMRSYISYLQLLEVLDKTLHVYRALRSCRSIEAVLPEAPHNKKKHRLSSTTHQEFYHSYIPRRMNSAPTTSTLQAQPLIGC